MPPPCAGQPPIFPKLGFERLSRCAASAQCAFVSWNSDAQNETGPCGPDLKQDGSSQLLDLRFLELNVLLDDRVVLRLRHLVRHGTAVLRGDVEEARVGSRQKLDLDGCCFRHFSVPQ